jgi:hypothetical protein
MRDESEVNAYMQLTFAVGFIAICQDVVGLLRAALVNTTLPSPCPDTSHSNKSTSESSVHSISTLQELQEEVVEEDKPRERYWYRRLSDLLWVGFLGALVPGIVGNSLYAGAVKKKNPTLVFRLRYQNQSATYLPYTDP